MIGVSARDILIRRSVAGPQLISTPVVPLHEQMFYGFLIAARQQQDNAAHRSKRRMTMNRSEEWDIRYFCAAAVLLLLAGTSGAAAQSAADFYRGKSIRMLLPTGPGGGRALYALPFADAFGRHIPGQPKVVPVFMPGAGGSSAINNAQNVAAPDGLTIVSPLKGAVIAQAVGDPSVKYDLSKFNWIGRITDATQILFVSSTVSGATIDDFRREQIIIAAVGRASVTYQNAAFINNVLGTKFKIVTGYRSAGATNASVETGETQGAFTTWNDLHSYHPDWLRDEKVRVILQIALERNPELKKIPLLDEFARNEGDRELIRFMSSGSELGQTFAAPPAVPADLIAALRKGFQDTMQDPDYVAKLCQSQIQFNPMTGERLSEMVRNTIGAPKSIIERYKQVIE